MEVCLGMRATALVLSNNILYRARKEKVPVTPMKLQKLLYYVCVKYMKDTKEYPLSEPFEVWQYGPVIPSVYSEFKPYGASEIENFARNAKGKAKMIDEDEYPELHGALEYVWHTMKGFSGTALSERTHQKGSGWYAAFQRSDEVIKEEDILNDATL